MTMVRPRVTPISACGRNASAVTDMKSSRSRRSAKSYRMGKSLIPLCVAVLVSACSSYAPSACESDAAPNLRESQAVSTAGLRPGGGVIVSVGVLPSARPAASSAGGGACAPDPNLYRLLLSMDSGAMQTVDLDNPTFFPNERVEVTGDGRVVRLSAYKLGAKS